MTEPARWTYKTTWHREDSDEDIANVAAHLRNMAEQGWELVSANAVWLHFTRTEFVGNQFVGDQIKTTGTLRHYFYWRNHA